MSWSIRTGVTELGNHVVLIGALLILALVLAGLLHAFFRSRTPKKRPVVRRVVGLGVALAVLAMMGAFGLSRSGVITRSWHVFAPPYGPGVTAPVPPLWAEGNGVSRRFAEIDRRRVQVQERVGEKMRCAQEVAARGAKKAVHSVVEAVVAPDGTSLLVLPPNHQVPAVAAGIPDRERLRHARKHHETERSAFSKGILRESAVWSVMTAFAIAAFLYVGYLFLDASTRGHFTWTLRILSAFAFVAICIAMAALRHRL